MFTGIIEAVGKVKSVHQAGGDVRVVIDAAGLDMNDVKLGDSIATSGVCLTVVDFAPQWYAADVSLETISRTTLNTWKTGTLVNLEKALLPTTRLGGHLVSGHVDGLGEVMLARKDARSLYLEVKAPDALAKYMAEKGSITVDGISLTINHLNGALMSLNLVPHTATQTTINEWQVGSKVNLEIDVLARYLERLLMGDKAAQATTKSPIDMSFLAENGFLR